MQEENERIQFVPVAKDGDFVYSDKDWSRLMDSQLLEIHWAFKRNGKEYVVLISDLEVER